jgi:hypothetical protein
MEKRQMYAKKNRQFWGEWLQSYFKSGTLIEQSITALQRVRVSKEEKGKKVLV